MHHCIPENSLLHRLKVVNLAHDVADCLWGDRLHGKDTTQRTQHGALCIFILQAVLR